ncbi:MAG: hypothetical protein EP311_03815 [Cytophagales bacterium]|uniref:Uncharacterized protein n=1 Tax=Algoriphagus taiwanensis TaxID=1445656 RepID=A0ABQ6PZV6_9BACT|nr:MAG: hypothetical protein EP311_03815 [Cytophagales bacterium]GMQ33136.1 hypothetical protein Ataiwa_14080 [Algoriphagus taiwanensis]
MEKITIEVSKSVANAWNALEDKKKKEINELVSKIISQSEKSKNIDYWERLREIRKNASEKGLTEDILNQILNED